MMAIVVDETQAAAKSRLAAIRLTMLTLRTMDNWRLHVADYDSAMILVAVVAITSERLTRTQLEAELQNLDQALPAEKLGKCNISSIAAGTGLNRETTRRKVNELVKADLLVRSEDGSIGFRPGLLQEPATLDLVRRQLEGIARAANDLVRDGILRLD